MENNNKKNIIAKIIAWTGLLTILALIIIMIIAMIIGNGKLAHTMIISIIYISILFWVGLGFYKRKKL